MAKPCPGIYDLDKCTGCGACITDDEREEFNKVDLDEWIHETVSRKRMPYD